MRAGGDRRGSNKHRRLRKVWLLATFDRDLGPDLARCHLQLSDRCKQTVTFETVTADRIEPCGSYRHQNIRPACAPCQNKQGALITREKRHQWFAWKREAELAGIEWDGTL